VQKKAQSYPLLFEATDGAKPSLVLTVKRAQQLPPTVSAEAVRSACHRCECRPVDAMGSSRPPSAIAGTRLRWAACHEDEATWEAVSRPLCCQAGRLAAFLQTYAGLLIAESPAAGAAGQTRALPPFLVPDAASNRRRHARSDARA